VTTVFLHALPLDERRWPQGEALRLYGRGRRMDAWARSILDEVDGELVLVGASMGGYCALAAARLAPERMRGLALVGSRVEPDTPERREGRAQTIETIRRGGAAALWEDMRPKLFPDGADAAVVEWARSIALEQRSDDLVAAVEAIRDRADSTDVWASLDVPTLIAVGDGDPFVSVEDALAHAEAARHGRSQVFEGCGHLPSLEQPDEFERVLEEFLGRV
jgi:pimeloyl-ACP methyl ester carboxylesterase